MFCTIKYRHDTKLRVLHNKVQTWHKAVFCTMKYRHNTKLCALHKKDIQHQTDTTQSCVHCTKRPFSIKQTRHKAMCTAQWSHSVSNSTTETRHKTMSIAWWSLLHKSTGQLACLHKVQNLFFFLSSLKRNVCCFCVYFIARCCYVDTDL